MNTKKKLWSLAVVFTLISSLLMPMLVYATPVGPIMASAQATITFNEQVAGRTPTNDNATIGDAFGKVLPIPQRNLGYHFLGWFTASTEGIRIDATDIILDTSITLFGQWQSVPQVGNDHFQRNLELFPDLWDPALNDGRGGVAPIFSNAADRVIVEEVFIEAPLDTDFDGQRDLMRIAIRRPIETLVHEDYMDEFKGLTIPVKIEMTPYTQGNIRGNTYRVFMNRTDIDFPDQGPARTRFSHTRFRGHNPDFDWDACDLRAWENPPRSYLYDTIYGPEGDLSYRALRDLVNRRVGVSPEAGVARHRELLYHDMLMREAHEYTDWHRENFSWLPPARTPTGWQRDGAPIWTDNPELGRERGGYGQPVPGSVGFSGGNFGPIAQRMARGIGAIRVEYLGNRHSQGITVYGQVEESLAAAAVIDWLNGRIRGFADPEGTIEVEAYWATGEAGATGWSYNGTLPLAAAMTGVEGLRTIKPAVAPSLSYAYVRENATRNAWGIWGNGACLFSMTMGMHGNAWFMLGAPQGGATGTHGRPGSIFFPSDDPGIHNGGQGPNTFETFSPASVMDTMWSFTRYMQEHADDLTGDYSPWWAERNALSFGEDMRSDVGVIIVHGINDYNVTMRHAWLYNEMLQYHGVEVVKGIFTQAGHGPGAHTPNSFFQTPETIEWLEHYLWGIENGITDRMPNFSIECNTRPWNNVNSVWHESDVWPLGKHTRFFPDGNRVGNLSLWPPAESMDLAFEDDMILDLVRHANSNMYDDTWFENDINWWPQYIQNMGLRRETMFYRGQGQGSGPQVGRWTNWIIGANDLTTAWVNGRGNNLESVFTSGQQPRYGVSPAAADAGMDFTKEIQDRLLFTMPIEEDFRVSGIVAMTAEVAANRDEGVISAMLIEIAENNAVRIVGRSGVDVRNPNPAGTLAHHVPGMSNVEYGGHWIPNFKFQSVDIVPGEFYSYTWELDVTDYTFRAGRTLGLIIYGSDPGFSLRPVSETTEFTVRTGSGTFLQLPIVGDTFVLPTFGIQAFNNGNDNNGSLANLGVIRMWTQLDGVNALVSYADLEITAVFPNNECAMDVIRINRIWNNLNYVNLIDVNKTVNWERIYFTAILFGQVVELTLVNNRFVPQEPLPIFTFNIFNNGYDGSPSTPNASLAQSGTVRMWTRLDGVNSIVPYAELEITAVFPDGECAMAFVRVNNMWANPGNVNLVDVSMRPAEWERIYLTAILFGQTVEVVLVNAEYVPSAGL